MRDRPVGCRTLPGGLGWHAGGERASGSGWGWRSNRAKAPEVRGHSLRAVPGAEEPAGLRLSAPAGTGRRDTAGGQAGRADWASRPREKPRLCYGP